MILINQTDMKIFQHFAVHLCYTYKLQTISINYLNVAIYQNEQSNNLSNKRDTFLVFDSFNICLPSTLVCRFEISCSLSIYRIYFVTQTIFLIMPIRLSLKKSHLMFSTLRKRASTNLVLKGMSVVKQFIRYEEKDAKI